MIKHLWPLALVACTKKDPTPVPIADAGFVAPPVIVDASGASAAREAGPSALPRTPAEIAKDAKPPEDARRIGKLAIWAQEDGDFSLVLAAQGTDSAKIIRRTSGHVTDLQAARMNDGELAIAWTSSLVGNQGQLSAVTFASADLARVSAPVTLALIGKVTDQGHIAIMKNPRGGVLVAHEGPIVGCSMSGHPTECVSFEVKAVSVGGKVDKLGTQSLDGGPSPEFWIVDLEDRGALVYGSSMRGGRTLGALVVPWASSDTAPSFEPPHCGGMAASTPEILRGASGEVVCLDVDARHGEKLVNCIKPLRGDLERCLRVGVTSKDGTPVMAKGSWDTPVTKVECVDKKTKITFAGGDATLASSSSHVADWLRKKCD